MQINIGIRLQAAVLTLAEAFNVTRAAERLRITQPALSRPVVELESRLGFPVFIRGQKRVHAAPNPRLRILS
ncbi:helix-turn-helix domain-containing protein [Granulicella sibirica]|uniref:helix-turn-helix domain-containing protein n=1 Tax=Granulicella sibirica TaxID=2479048 RepID=UPI0013754AC1